MTPRTLLSVIRLSIASAKFRLSPLVEVCDVDEALRLHTVARAAVDEAMGTTTTRNPFGTFLNNRVDPRDMLKSKVLEKTKEILQNKGGQAEVGQLVTELKMRCECSETDVQGILNHYIQMNHFSLNEDGTEL